jgi:hypothetical protein
MKSKHAWIVYMVLGAMWLKGAEAEENIVITERGPHHRVWQQPVPVATHFNQTRWITNSYRELSAGMHYFKEGAWLEASGEIELLNGGAMARQGQHTVTWAANLNTRGAIHLVAADGKVFDSHIIGLAYRDVATGQSVMIAEIKDSIGALFAPSRIVYSDAFTDFKVDVVYDYSIAGFEQTVVVRENPPSPSAYGLNPATTILEAWTEFLEPPAPQVTARTLSPLQANAPALPDQKLDFGAMHMGKGRAFTLENLNLEVPVGKQWTKVEQRDFLIETVVYSSVAPWLATLPAAPLAAVDAGKARMLALNGKPPGAPSRKENKTPMRMAKVTDPRNGLAIDYGIVATAANVTLEGTCYVSSNVTLTGVTTIRGGAIIKFNTNGAKITIAGTVNCTTEPYHPAIFTARDDNTVGETISGSTGTPSGYYAGTALFFDSTASDLKHLRFLYANKAVQYDSDTTGQHLLRHSQILNCRSAVVADNARFALRNVLLYNVLTNFSAAGATASTGTLEHVTVDLAGYLNSASGMTLNVTNSIIAGVTNFGYGFNGSNSVTVAASSSGLFQTVAAGAHYLANGDTQNRDTGTTNIDATLLADLKSKSTYAPDRLTNNITTNTTWKPGIPRDTDTPDRGYEYDAVDLIVCGVTVTNATLWISNGFVVAAEYGVTNYGLRLHSGAYLIGEGSPTRPNRFTSVRAVQEKPTATNSIQSVLGSALHPNIYPALDLRFTHFAGLSSDYHYFEAHGCGYVGSIYLRDCEMKSGNFVEGASSDTENSTTFFNNLWDHVAIELYQYGANSVSLRNNTFIAGSLSLWASGGLSGDAANNLFDKTTINDNSEITHGYDAYVDTYSTLNGGTGGTDIDLGTSPSYQTGALGNYYLPSSAAALINTGTGTANGLGLWHYTVLTNNVKETNTVVDVGVHRVAINLTTGEPYDYDGDGISDYWEDRDGNGSYAVGELNWLNADTDGDGVADGLELLQGRNPLGGITNDVNNLLNLRVFTPLK